MHLRPEWLKCQLVSGDSVTVARSEIIPALRHRLSLFYLTAIISLKIVLDLRGIDRDMVLWQDAMFFVVLKLGLVAGGAAGLHVLRWRMRRAPVLPVHMSVLTVMMAAGMVAGSEIVIWYRGGPILANAALFVALFLVYWTIIEIEMILYCTWIVPHILRDLRSRDPAAARFDSIGSAPAPAIRIGDLSIDPATVRHVRAEGNYVEIRTDMDKHYLLATFSTVVAGLDGQDGQQIHRSHWIAARVLTGFYRDGRDIIVRLEDGTEVAVAQSRQKELLPWLQTVTVRL